MYNIVNAKIWTHNMCDRLIAMMNINHELHDLLSYYIRLYFQHIDQTIIGLVT